MNAGIELKTVNPVVFKSDKYCSDLDGIGAIGNREKYECCEFSTSLPRCILFNGVHLETEDFGNKTHKILKCQQCKEHCQKN